MPLQSSLHAEAWALTPRARLLVCWVLGVTKLTIAVSEFKDVVRHLESAGAL
jgi:hypothetical protein